MSDLISRQAAIDAIEKHKHDVLDGRQWDEGVEYGYAAAHNHICDVISHMPAAKRVRKWIPVSEALPTAERVGKWTEVTNKWGGLEIRCSECGAQVPRDGWGNGMQCDYCPNCGARMEDEQGEV